MTAVIEPTGQVRESETLGARLQHTLHRHPAIGPASVLVLSVIAFSIANPRFLNATNVSLILLQVAVVGSLAVAQTLVILTAGIDLSVGAADDLRLDGNGITGGGLSPACQGSPSPSRSASLVGVLAGLLNGVLVSVLRLPPFITTLGTLSIFTALGLLYNGGPDPCRREAGALLWTGASWASGRTS